MAPTHIERYSAPKSENGFTAYNEAARSSESDLAPAVTSPSDNEAAKYKPYEEAVIFDERNKKARKTTDSLNTTHTVKHNIFKRFWRWITEYIGPPSLMVPRPAQSFCNFVDLADAQFGTKVLFVTDQFFGSAMNMFKTHDPKVTTEPQRNEEALDGWVTRRRRQNGHDWCVVQLGLPGTIYGFEVNLANLKSDSATRISIEATFCASLTSEFVPPSIDEKEELSIELMHKVDDQIDAILESFDAEWVELLDPAQASFDHTGVLEDSYFFSVEDPYLVTNFTHLRFNLFPDGGISRIRVFGQPMIKQSVVYSLQPKDCINVLSPTNGGNLLLFDASSLLVGHPKEIIIHSKTCRSAWETVRKSNRPPIISRSGILYSNKGDWAIYKFHSRVVLEEIHVNGKECTGKVPSKILIEILDHSALYTKDLLDEQRIFERDSLVSSSPLQNWKLFAELFPSNVEPIIIFHARESYTHWSQRTATHLRITLIPDGGISGLVVMGAFLK